MPQPTTPINAADTKASRTFSLLRRMAPDSLSPCLVTVVLFIGESGL